MVKNSSIFKDLVKEIGLNTNCEVVRMSIVVTFTLPYYLRQHPKSSQSQMWVLRITLQKGV